MSINQDKLGAYVALGKAMALAGLETRRPSPSRMARAGGAAWADYWTSRGYSAPARYEAWGEGPLLFDPTMPSHPITRGLAEPTEDELAGQSEAERGISALKTQIRRQARRAALEALADQGVDLDVDEELDDVEDMDQDEFKSHIIEITKKYRRGIPPLRHEQGPTPAQAKALRDQAARDALKVVEYARRHGIADGFEAVKRYSRSPEGRVLAR